VYKRQVFVDVNEQIQFGDAGEYIYGDGSNLQFVSSNAVGFDAANGIILDGGSGGTILKAGGGTTYGSLVNSSGDLIIKSGTTTALTFSGANVTLPADLTIGANLDVSSGTIKLAGSYPVGTNNVALGSNAGTNLTSGSQSNTLIGNFAGDNISATDFNTAVGNQALRIGSGSNLRENTAIGYKALEASTTPGNTAVGYQAGINISVGNNNTVIGASATASSASVDNEITLGNSSVTSLRIPGLQSGATSGDVLTYDGTDITLSTPSTGVSKAFVMAMGMVL